MGGEKKSAVPQVVGIDCWRSRRGFFPHLYHRHHYYQPRSGQHSYLLSRFDFAAKKIEKVCTREPHHLSVCGARAYPIHSTHSKREEATATKKKTRSDCDERFYMRNSHTRLQCLPLPAPPTKSNHFIFFIFGHNKFTNIGEPNDILNGSTLGCVVCGYPSQDMENCKQHRQ